jgi:hypothetical protein
MRPWVNQKEMWCGWSLCSPATPFFKREVAGDVGAAWADERIEAGNLLVGPEDGDELVAIFDFNGLIDLLESELAGSRENESESES